MSICTQSLIFADINSLKSIIGGQIQLCGDISVRTGVKKIDFMTFPQITGSRIDVIFMRIPPFFI